MRLRFRARPRLGPLRFNVTERGLRSVSVKIGPFTWNPQRGRVTTNLPGGLHAVQDVRPVPAVTCRCGHEPEVHQHYRTGTDCGRCPCPRYRKARRP